MGKASNGSEHFSPTLPLFTSLRMTQDSPCAPLALSATIAQVIQLHCMTEHVILKLAQPQPKCGWQEEEEKKKKKEEIISWKSSDILPSKAFPALT